VTVSQDQVDYFQVTVSQEQVDYFQVTVSQDQVDYFQVFRRYFTRSTFCLLLVVNVLQMCQEVIKYLLTGSRRLSCTLWQIFQRNWRPYDKQLINVPFVSGGLCCHWPYRVLNTSWNIYSRIFFYANGYNTFGRVKNEYKNLLKLSTFFHTFYNHLTLARVNIMRWIVNFNPGKYCRSTLAVSHKTISHENRHKV
jgi:hypothetical protein